MPANAKRYLSTDFLHINDLSSGELISKAIDKLKTLPKTCEDYRVAFHSINVLICNLAESDPYKPYLIKKLFLANIKKTHTLPFNNHTKPLSMGQ
jgi:hypothetical protein